MKSLKFFFYVLFCLFVSVLIVSCIETSNKVTTISFNPRAKKRNVFKTGVIKSVRLVKLESDSCIIGEVDKIICNDTLLYILDRHIANEVFIFTKEGRFVNKISRHGHGKYEYTQLFDIFFNKERNSLCLLCRYDQKILSFTPDGRKILGESRLPQMFNCILPTKNGYVGYMGNSIPNPSLPYNVWTMDDSFNLMDGFVPVAPQLKGRFKGGVNTLSAYGDAVYFKPEYDNNIYKIKDEKISRHYILDFGNKTTPNLSTIDRDVEMGLTLLQLRTVSNIYNYIENDDYILMDFVMNTQYYLGIYNKRKRTSEIAEIDIYNDIYRFSFGTIKGMDQSAIYSAVSYEGVYNTWLGHSKRVNFEKLYPKQVKNLRKRYPHLEEDGNPFIAIYSLK